MLYFELTGGNGELEACAYDDGTVRIEVQEDYRETYGHSVYLDQKQIEQLANFLLRTLNKGE